VTNPQQQYEKPYSDELSTAKSNLTRWLREDDSGTFTKPIWNEGIQFSGPTVNDLLNQAVPGLDWFERALVRYHRVWDVLHLQGFDQINIPGNAPIGFAGDTIHTVVDPRADNGVMLYLEGTYFDQQRHMDAENLRQLAQKLQIAATGGGADASLPEVTQDVAGVANSMGEVWQGQSGDAAQDHMVGFHTHADQQTQFVQALASALTGLPEVLLSIVKDKATFIGQFASDQMPVAGHAMKLDGASDDPVSMIIGAANGDGDLNSVMGGQFHSPVSKNDDGGSSTIETTCKTWLTDHFGPAVREAVNAFVQQCALADYYIKQAYKPVTDLLSNQDPAEFPKPQNPQQPNNNQQQGPTTSGPTPTNVTTAGLQQSPTDTTGAQQNPTATNPASLNPSASQSNPLSSLSGLMSQGQQAVQAAESGVGQLTSTLGSGAGQVQSAVQNGLSGLLGNSTNPASAIAGAAGSKTLANFSLGGEKLSVAQGSDGTVTTTVTGPDGKAQQYSMGIKNGVPFFAPGGDPAASASKDPAHDSPSSSAGPGASGGAGPSLTGGSSPQPSVINPSDSSAVPHEGSSVPAAGSAASTSPAGVSTASAAGGTTASAPSMGSMPHMGGGGGGGEKGDGEHKSSGVVQAKPMWTGAPGPDRKPVIESATAAAESEQDLFGAEFELADQHFGGSLSLPDPAAPVMATAPSPAPVMVAPAPEPPAVVSAPAPRTDGVKIEIDMGDGK